LISTLHKKLEVNYSQGKKITPGFCILVLFFLGFLFANKAVLAQDGDSLIVQPPDISQFPEISVSFKFPASENELISDLKSNHLMVYENGNPIPPDSLTKERSGVHFTLAINPGMELDLRDVNGISPYDKLRDVLVDWAHSRSSVIGDAWSFISDTGVEIGNSKDRALWIDALNAYQPNFRVLEPQLSSLELAVELSSERIVLFGVDKAILYITPAPLPGQIEAINEISRKASLAGIQVNVWMIDEAYFLNNDQGGALVNLAKNTGGKFFHYTGSEDIPNPETYLIDLGFYFTLLYQSSIRETDTHSLRIELTAADNEISGSSPSFYLEVKPPNPILVCPPAVINRTQSGDQTGDLYPSTQAIEVMVEFPDHHHRPISVSRLIVDGKVVDERKSASAEVLEWDLTSILGSGEHDIQVEVEDSLGLSAKTIMTPVYVEVTLPEPEQNILLGNIGLVFLGILIVTSLIILISWLIKRYWQSDNFSTMLPARFTQDKECGNTLSKLTENQKRVIAKLIPLEFPTENSDRVLNIMHSRVYIGRDPGQEGLVLDDPSVDDTQTFLLQSEEEFWVNDLDSTMGTWVNYVKINGQPTRIKSGDILHFGNCGFRFTIVDDDCSKQVTLTKYEPLI